MQVQFPGVARDFFLSQLSVQTLAQPCAEWHALRASLLTLQILSIGSHTTEWIHTNTSHARSYIEDGMWITTSFPTEQADYLHKKRHADDYLHKKRHADDYLHKKRHADDYLHKKRHADEEG